MRTAFSGSKAVLLLAVLLIGTPASTAAAQSQADMRRENERLRARLDELTREIEALQKQLADAAADNQRLRQLVNTRPAGSDARVIDPPEPERVTVDESVPTASPRAMLAAIVRSYEEITADHEIGEDWNDPQRTAYMRVLERWVPRTNRELREPIEWHVRIVGNPVRVGRGFTLRLEAVDPETLVVLGDPFDAYLPRTRLSKLQQLDRQRRLDDVLVLKGTMVPRVHINDTRMEAGPFDNPRFVGPFVEFGFGVNAGTLLPPPPPDDEEKTSGKAKPARSAGQSSL
jgi:hypothetical protein